MPAPHAFGQLRQLGAEAWQSWHIGRSFAAYLGVAARTGWSSARLARYQRARLRAVLTRAACSSAFLRARRPERALDLEAWPLVSRADIQAEPIERLLAPGFTPAACVSLATTGSTGEPLRVHYSHRDLRHRWLYFVRMFRAYGLGFFCRLVQIENYPASRIRRPGDRATWDRRSFLSVRDPVDRRLDLLAQADPEAIVGFSTDLAEMGRRVRERGMAFPSLRVVMGVGDVMTDECRTEIERGFGAPVRDFYGAAEAGLIAYECPAGMRTYHVNADNLFVEILRDGRRATAGEVVVTPLAYEAMPLIRYRLGDAATWADGCPCGSGLPALGRSQH